MNIASLKKYYSEDSLRPEIAIKKFYQMHSELSSMLDLGANNGFHSIGFVQSASADKHRRCLSVEANQNTYGELISKIDAAGLSSSIEPIFSAVQEDPTIKQVKFMECAEQPGRSGILPFWTGMSEHETKGMSFSSTIVPATTVDNLIDSYNFTNLSFIKADLEGGEYSAFKGASNTLQSLRPIVVFERSIVSEAQYGYNRKDWFALFDSSAYKLCTFFGDEMSLDNYYDFWYVYALPIESLGFLESIKTIAIAMIAN